jgi:hypothetical protein
MRAPLMFEVLISLSSAYLLDRHSAMLSPFHIVQLRPCRSALGSLMPHKAFVVFGEEPYSSKTLSIVPAQRCDTTSPRFPASLSGGDCR